MNETRARLGTFLVLAIRTTSGSTSECKIRENALAPEGPSPLEMAGNLYVYLIPSIFKEERGADREEPPRGPSSPAGSCFEERTAVRDFSYNT